MAGTRQRWRHICVLSEDITIGVPPVQTQQTIYLPKHLLVQGCEKQRHEVLIADRFQGAYTCVPEITLAPVDGELEFIGNGWIYRKLPSFSGSDSFEYRMYAPDLDLYSEVAQIILN